MSQVEQIDEESQPMQGGFLEHYDELRAFLLRKTGCPHDALDLTQDAMVRVLRLNNKTRVNDPRRFLFRTGYNLFIDRIRKNRSRNLKTDAAGLRRDSIVDPRPCPSSVAELREMADLLQKSIDSLPPRCREVFVLSRFTGMSYSEIASHLKISQSAVEKHIMLALAHCRRSLKQLNKK